MRLEYDPYQKALIGKLSKEFTIAFIITTVVEFIFFYTTSYADTLTRIFIITYISLIYVLIRKLYIGTDLSPLSHIYFPLISKRSRRVTQFILVMIFLIGTSIIFSNLWSGNVEAFLIDGKLAAFRSSANFTTPMLSFLLWLHIFVNVRIRAKNIED